MITRVEALNYRSLRYVSQTLLPFQVLIGANASGKSTFLDVIAFLSDLLNAPIPDAVSTRTPNIMDLTWMGKSNWVELAVEAEIPSNLRTSSHSYLRYEVRIGAAEDRTITALAEALWLFSPPPPVVSESPQSRLFPNQKPIPETITLARKHSPAGWRKLVSKTESGFDYFKSEKTDWNNQFRFGARRSALANLPEDETRFPAATWFKRNLAEGVQRIMLNSAALRRPSPPNSPRTFLPDGSNLPFVVHDLSQRSPQRFTDWVAHLRTALPDLKDIQTVERPEDRHRYLEIIYNTGLRAPSWSVSDGTLRLLALTILSYLPNLEGIFLIEEPENGIHPSAVETVIQSLSSVYNAQILLATHSPVILSQTRPEQLLCFGRTEEGETDIIRGDQHPRLAEWRNEVNLGVLFASGVLG
ncbi:MAG: ATP-binding protein [Anaerolineae bacterium]